MKIANILKKCRNIYRILKSDIKFYVYSKIFYPCKIKKGRIILNNFNGKGFGDSPKYIANEIIRQKLPYELIWIVKNKKADVPKEIKKIKIGSIQEAYMYATSSIIICNSKQRLPFKKKTGQYYIQTWHGAFPLKYIEQEAEAFLSKRYVKHSKQDSAITDLMLSGSGMETEIMKKSFWYSGEIFECGIPRDDIFFNHNKNNIEQLKLKNHLPLNVKIVIYAPTFRDNGRIDVYNINLKEILFALEKKTNEKWICIVRLHPNISHQDNLFTYNDEIINGSQYPDPQELFIISDFLITDYSSVMMDFGLMKKPVVLYFPDFEEYQNNRGLRPIFDILPFPHGYQNEDLYKIIQKFDQNEYINTLNYFIEHYYKNYSDGYASERVVSRIKEIIEEDYQKIPNNRNTKNLLCMFL